MDKDLRISQTPGAIFAERKDGALEMRGNLPTAFLQRLKERGEWQTINAFTYGMYRAAWWFSSHTTFSFEYIRGSLYVSVGADKNHVTAGTRIRAEDLSFEHLIVELMNAAIMVRAYLRVNPDLGYEKETGSHPEDEVTG